MSELASVLILIEIVMKKCLSIVTLLFLCTLPLNAFALSTQSNSSDPCAIDLPDTADQVKDIPARHDDSSFGIAGQIQCSVFSLKSSDESTYVAFGELGFEKGFHNPYSGLISRDTILSIPHTAISAGTTLHFFKTSTYPLRIKSTNGSLPDLDSGVMTNAESGVNSYQYTFKNEGSFEIENALKTYQKLIVDVAPSFKIANVIQTPIDNGLQVAWTPTRLADHFSFVVEDGGGFYKNYTISSASSIDLMFGKDIDAGKSYMFTLGGYAKPLMFAARTNSDKHNDDTTIYRGTIYTAPQISSIPAQPPTPQKHTNSDVSIFLNSKTVGDQPVKPSVKVLPKVTIKSTPKQIAKPTVKKPTPKKVITKKISSKSNPKLQKKPLVGKAQIKKPTKPKNKTFKVNVIAK